MSIQSNAERAVDNAYDMAMEAMSEAFESALSSVGGYIGGVEFNVGELVGDFKEYDDQKIPEGTKYDDFLKKLKKIDKDAVVVVGPGDMFDSDEKSGSVYIFSGDVGEESEDDESEEDDEFKESTINKTVDRLLTEDANVAMSDVKVLGNLGDVHPFDYGGLIISEDLEGKGRIFAEYWDEPQNENAKYIVYRFEIEKDAVADLSWVKEKDWESLAEALGESVDEFKAHGKSEDPLERAIIYREVGGYWGYDNFDSYPLELTRAEMEKRWPQYA